jgi:hypothetical protein
MNRRSHALALIAAVAITVACGGGSGGGSSPTAPSATGPSMPTVTIGDNNISPNVVRIDVNQQVRFVNNATRSVQIASDPHPTHEMCPPMNELGMLTPGQSRNTGSFTRSGTCTFHDHGNPENSAFRGTILVSVNEPGPGPVYATPF